MKKRRLLIAVVTAMAMAVLLSKPAFHDAYAKSYKEEDVITSITVLQEGDRLLFPEWAPKTQAMFVRYLNEKGHVQKNIKVEAGKDYEIPAYDDLELNDPIPAGNEFSGWVVAVKPLKQFNSLYWDLTRCTEPVATPEPTDTPTPEPTDTPTTAPNPTDTPTTAPNPTDTPTTAPELTDTPTTAPNPTDTPTTAPIPTSAPTAVPTAAPTAMPTQTPAAVVPTAVPTVAPTAVPTSAPTLAPTVVPTAAPTAVPSPVPTATPEPDIQNTVISQAGTYQLQPYIMYLLKGGITHVEGDITSYANPISFTVDSSSAYTFY